LSSEASFSSCSPLLARLSLGIGQQLHPSG
jgi:hypothetical protein